MADKVPATKEEQPTADAAPPGVSSGAAPTKSLGAKLVAVFFVLAVVLTECLAAYFFFPSPSAATAMTEGAAESDAKGESASKGHSKAGQDKKDRKDKRGGREEKSGKEGSSDQIEIDLGEYSVTAASSAGNSMLQITFHLYGTVASADEQEFEELKKENEHRFREQVLVVVRGAKISDLTDAGLGLLKRNILEKTNKVLGRPILRSVIFSDFVFIEQ